ncbi:MAG: lamin tail domain-containing protein [Archangium sp.]|nr:lamin tail domain-containing protein [Archangium sp.]MDP3572607.1 lamin tail domain-containing protein [Archangium sp.]
MQIRIAAVLGVLLVSGCRVVEPAPAPTAPRIDAFTASKTRTAPGEQVTLTFATTGATKVELTDDSGNSVQLDGAVDSGTATVAPTRSAFYVLRATGAGGRDTAFVQIAVNEPLQDLFLIAVPATIDSGEQGQLLWGAPGASTVTLKTGAEPAVTLTGTTGTVTVTPATTAQYTLTAQGAPGTPPLTALAQIRVRPVIRASAIAAPDGVQPGETLTLSWTTAGATRVTVTEMTFGQLADVTDPASAANGTFDFVLPTNLPNGVAVTDGLPLRFVIAATAGDVTVASVLNDVVGDEPTIDQLTAPEFVSAGTQFTVAWKTFNASQVSITVNGLPLFRTLNGAQTRVDDGSVMLAAPTTQTEYTLVASNDRGVTARRTFSVRPVAVPVINTFTITPSTVAALGDPATARWTTTNANRLQLRFENGATVASITTPSQIASGNVVLTPATSGRLVLEASNAAGDVVTEVRSITFQGTAVSITPTPALRGSTAVLSWTLAPAAVLETVGLPTPAGAPIPNSANFVDLSMDATAGELLIADPTNGFAPLTPPAGFRFPFLGSVRDLFVSVNGVITFSAPGALSDNSDFTLPANSAPSMIAPFWDDLSMGATSKVLYGLRTAVTGERFLVVQWDKFQLAADAASVLTFQAHLYETGQVAFVYQTLTGAVNSVTVGIKDAAWPLVQQFTFNSTATVPSVFLELNYLTGGPADGTLNLVANRSRQVSFFGRTATGLVIASTELRSFGPGDVTINEVMPFPEASVSALGQWIELRNNASVAVDFDGLLVDSTGSSVDGGYVIAPGTVVPAGGLLVLGQSLNPLDTGGAPVTQVATDLPLGAADRVRVQLQGTLIHQFTWDAGTPGTSLTAPEAVMVAAGQTFSCTRTATFGPAGALGTPGAANESCAPYVLTSIAGGFVPAPTGAEIFATIDGDEGFGDRALPVPFPYFGVPRTTFGLSTNGFITLGAPALTDSYFGNNTTVGTTAPNGVLAVFWDDMDRDVTGKNTMWRLSDRTIISWDNYQFFFNPADLNYQVHLLDNGVIEFHYGALSTTSTTQSVIDRVGGNSATVWIERPDGNLAIRSSVNQLNSIVPNSGLRFTPVP